MALYFEDFTVGQRFTSSTRRVTAEDLAQFTVLTGDDHPMHTDSEYATKGRFGDPILQGTFGAAVAAGLWSRLGVVSDSVVAGLSESWSYHLPIKVGDTLTLHVLVTRLSPRGEKSGEVTRHNELRNSDGDVVQSGTATTLISAAGRERSTARDVGTAAWGRTLAEALRENPQFVSAVASWDGTIGLRGGEQEIQLRIYRGQIIEVTRRTPHGATFTFGATDRVWADLLTAPQSRFGARLMTGEFQSSGDPYEYLRLTKAVELIVEVARAIARQDTAPTATLDEVSA